MGNARGLASLASLTIASCFGVTDLSLEAVTKGCSGLKQLSLNNCCFISDNGLTALSSSALSLESLHLEDCNRVTLSGVTYALSSFSSEFRSLSLVKCLNFKDTPFEPTPENRCMSLRSLSIRNCPGFGTSSLAILGTMCPNLNQVDLSGLYGITDDGILSLVNGSLSGLVKLNLSGCIDLSDESVLAIARSHGETIKVLSLKGCRKITDTSLLAISESCSLLNDLDISNCAITDSGIAVLSSSELNLQILSISGCSKISNKSLPFLIQLGQNLVGLNLKHCTSLTTKRIDMLIDNLWRCDILH